MLGNWLGPESIIEPASLVLSAISLQALGSEAMISQRGGWLPGRAYQGPRSLYMQTHFQLRAAQAGLSGPGSRRKPKPEMYDLPKY